jgi:hypothetical protein
MIRATTRTITSEEQREKLTQGGGGVKRGTYHKSRAAAQGGLVAGDCTGHLGNFNRGDVGQGGGARRQCRPGKGWAVTQGRAAARAL